MAIYELVLRQRYYEQETVNRWNYIMTGVPAAVTGAFALVSAFGAISLLDSTVLGFLQDMQNSQVNFVDVEARNVYSETDFYTRPFPVETNGTVTGSHAMSPIAAFGFRTNRVRTDVRRGTKRFVGLSEAQVTDGGALESIFQTTMQMLATRMSAPLTYDDEGNTLTFTPCICGKEAYPTPSGRTAYKYFETEAEQLAKTASGILWEVYDDMRTQNSRQYGRGR